MVQVSNEAPFRFKSRSFVCCNTNGELTVFELFADIEKSGLDLMLSFLLCLYLSEFAKAILPSNLPFVVNWSGPEVNSMAVDDKACLSSMVKFIAAIDNLQPNIEGKSKCLVLK